MVDGDEPTPVPVAASIVADTRLPAVVVAEDLREALEPDRGHGAPGDGLTSVPPAGRRGRRSGLGAPSGSSVWVRDRSIGGDGAPRDRVRVRARAKRCRTVRLAFARSVKNSAGLVARGGEHRQSRPRLRAVDSPPVPARSLGALAVLAVLAAIAVARGRAATPARRRRRRRSCPARRAPRARSTSSSRTGSSCPTRSTSSRARPSLLHVVNGGLEIHELVIGDQAVQDAWEAAEARGDRRAARPDARRERAAGRRRHPGRRPVRASASTSPGRCRPTAADVARLLLGCHIPGHWAEGHAGHGRRGRIVAAAGSVGLVAELTRRRRPCVAGRWHGARIRARRRGGSRSRTRVEENATPWPM